MPHIFNITVQHQPRLWRVFGSPGFAALLLAVALSALAAEPPPLIPWTAKQDAAADVATQVVQPRSTKPGVNAASGLPLQGTALLPAQSSDVLSMPVTGVVQALLVAPMQSVRAGQAVARIVSPQWLEWQREWLLAHGLAKLAQSKAQRDEQLFVEGIISEHRRNESRAQADMAQLTERERRLALRLGGMSEAALTQAASTSALSSQLTLLAPVAGTVLEHTATPGQRLEAGSPVAQIARAGRLVLELQATVAQAQGLRVGDGLTVAGCKTPARLSAIAPQVSSATQGVLLRAELTGREDCLRINQFVQVQVQQTRAVNAAAGNAAALSVPTQALVQQAGQSYVFVRKPQGYAPVAVQTGGALGNGETAITTGLQAGDAVVVKGVLAIKGAWLGLGAKAAAPMSGGAAK